MSYGPGLYDAELVSALVTSREAKDNATGQMITKHQLEIRAKLLVLNDKTGGKSPVESEPVVTIFRALSGGNLEGKGGEITRQWFEGLAGAQLLNEYGNDLFTSDGNALIAGRTVKIMATASDNPKYPLNFSVFNGKERASNPEVDRSDIRKLNNLFGISPTKKVGQKAVESAPQETVAAGTQPDNFI